MNYKLIALGASLLLGASASATTLDVKSFPAAKAPATETAAQQMPGMQRAPLNQTKNLGTKVFAYSTAGYYSVQSYLDFWTSNPRNLNRLHDITLAEGGCSYDTSNPDMLGNVGGVWAGDGYYAYRMIYYTFTSRLNNWVKVDPATGNAQELYLWNDTGAFDPDWLADIDWVNYSQIQYSPQSLLWNPNDPKALQVLCQNNDGTVTSALRNVDRSNGKYLDKVADMPDYYFAGVYDYDNHLYAIRWSHNSKGHIVGAVLDVFDNGNFSEPISSTTLKVDGKDWYIYYENNLTMDYTTGDLWWAATQISNFPSINANPDAQITPSVESCLIKINPETGDTENFGRLGWSETIGGMYIDYKTAESRQAPALVKDLGFTVDAAGANKVTINWTNPGTTWGRKELNDLSQVLVYRDSYEGQPVGTIDASGKENQKMSWTDENATKGIHTYYVVAVNAAGKGVPDDVEAFVGRDVPGPVANLTAVSPDGKSIQLTWSKPERGENDGWYDDSDLTYTITRLPDNKSLGTTKNLSYLDDTLGEMMLFSYVVTATSADGTGSEAKSNEVLAGKSISLPYRTAFETEVDANRFTAIDKNMDGRTWEYAYNLGVVGTKTMFNPHGYPSDDILASPSMLVEKDKTYKVVYHLRYFSTGETGETINHPMRLVGGTVATAEGMNTVFEDVTDNELPVFEQTGVYTAYFKAPITGEYYIGLEDLTPNDDRGIGMNIEAVEISEAPDDDLQAMAISTHRSISTIEDNTFNVEVYNNGSKTQSKYSVKVAYMDEDNNEVVFAQTSDVPELASHQADVVEVVGHPDELGVFNIYAIVDMEGDGNADNDRSPAVEVSFDEAPALNVTLNSFVQNGENSNLPISHYYRYSASQTIYTPEMTAFDRIFAGKNPRITRMAWEYNGRTNTTGTEIEVYLTQTNYTGFISSSSTETVDGLTNTMIPLAEETTPLFSGEVEIVYGDNYMIVDLDDEFSFDPSMPILVTVVKDDATNAGTFPIGFMTFDYNWECRDFHSFVYQGNSAYSLSAPTGRMNANPDAPILHLAIKSDNSGIDEVALTGKGAVYYNALSATVEAVDFEMASVDVYTLDGKLVKSVAVAEGAASAAINCANGMYLLKVNGVDGSIITLKAVVK